MAVALWSCGPVVMGSCGFVASLGPRPRERLSRGLAQKHIADHASVFQGGLQKCFPGIAVADCYAHLLCSLRNKRAALGHHYEIVVQDVWNLYQSLDLEAYRVAKHDELQQWRSFGVRKACTFKISHANSFGNMSRPDSGF